jgi:hypothetical protein
MYNIQNKVDIDKKLHVDYNHGFPRNFANLNYMHYAWKLYLISWQYQFNDKNNNNIIILETIINRILWFWHVHFGLPKEIII